MNGCLADLEESFSSHPATPRCTKMVFAILWNTRHGSFEKQLPLEMGLRDVWRCKSLVPGKALLMLQVQGPSRPAPRRRHTAVQYKDKMYIFGGMTHDHRCEYLRDLWALDLHRLQWERLPALTDESCSHHGARTGHVAAVHGHSMWVFGGFVETAEKQKILMGDLVRFDLEKKVHPAWL